MFAVTSKRPNLKATMPLARNRLHQGPRRGRGRHAGFFEAAIEREKQPLQPILVKSLDDIAVDWHHRLVGSGLFTGLAREVERPDIESGDVVGRVLTEINEVKDRPFSVLSGGFDLPVREWIDEAATQLLAGIGVAHFIPEGAKTTGGKAVWRGARELKRTEARVNRPAGRGILAVNGEGPEIDFVCAQAPGAGE